MMLKDYWTDAKGNIFYGLGILIIVNIFLCLGSPIKIILSDVLYLDMLLCSFSLVALLWHYFSWRKKTAVIYKLINGEELNTQERHRASSGISAQVAMEMTHLKATHNSEVGSINNALREVREYMLKWVHEIKVPITVMHMISKELDQNKCRELEQELYRTEYLVNQVMQINRLHSFHEDIHYQEVNLEKVIHKVVKEHRSLLQRRNIGVNCNDIHYKVLSDEKWLFYILNQFLHNAIKYSPDNSMITIGVDEQGETTTLYLLDQGKGIVEKDKLRIWDKGFTGENGRQKESSTGMGLYMVKKICEVLNHDLQVSSQIDEGTKVSVIFNPLKDVYVTKMSS